MLPTRADLEVNLAAALRLSRFDLGAIRAFDLSEQGFWRSFRALGVAVVLGALSLHLFTIGSAADHTPGDPLAPPPVLGLFHALSLYGLAEAASSLVFIAVVAVACWFGGMRGGFVPFIVAHNWIAMMIAVVSAALGLLYAGGILPAALVGFLGLALVLWSLGATGAAAHAGLGAGIGVAIAVVVVDLLVTHYVMQGVFAVFGTGEAVTAVVG